MSTRFCKARAWKQTQADPGATTLSTPASRSGTDSPPASKWRAVTCRRRGVVPMPAAGSWADTPQSKMELSFATCVSITHPTRARPLSRSAVAPGGSTSTGFGGRLDATTATVEPPKVRPPPPPPPPTLTTHLIPPSSPSLSSLGSVSEAIL